MAVNPQLTGSSSTLSRTRWPRIIRLAEPLDARDSTSRFAAAVRSGLSGQPKSLPWSYFYDAEGSRLFDEICKLPEYYLTRTEDGILRRHADAMVALLASSPGQGTEPTIVELGSGSAVKTQRLLSAALRQHHQVHYVPIDVSPQALEDSAETLSRRFAGVRVTGYVGDYRRGLERIMARAEGPRLIVFLGSSLGNYDHEAALELLRMVGRTMRPGDGLLMGTDLAKERALLEFAYNDSRGVTAAFNMNLLRRINRELQADFDLEHFEHLAYYVDHPQRGHVAIHLRSRVNQTVHIQAAGTKVELAAGELIHTEKSHKYTLDALAELRRSAGFEEAGAWTDERGWFRVQLWCPADGPGL